MRHKNESMTMLSQAKKLEVWTYSWVVNEDTEEYEAKVKLEYTTENGATVTVWKEKQCDSEPEPSDHWNLMCEAMNDIAETVGLDKCDTTDTEQEADKMRIKRRNCPNCGRCGSERVETDWYQYGVDETRTCNRCGTEFVNEFSISGQFEEDE